MKRMTIICLTVMFMLFAGCAKSTYRGHLGIGVNGSQSVLLPIWIQIGEPIGPLQEPLNSMTKGTGGVGSAEDFVDRPIYIYAWHHFSADKDCQGKDRGREGKVQSY